MDQYHIDIAVFFPQKNNLRESVLHPCPFPNRYAVRKRVLSGVGNVLMTHRKKRKKKKRCDLFWVLPVGLEEKLPTRVFSFLFVS